MPSYGSLLARMYYLLDCLDAENDDNVRADLIDEAIGLADSDPQAAAAWEAYR